MHTRKVHTSTSEHKSADIAINIDSSQSSQSNQGSQTQHAPPSLKYDHSFSKDWDLIEAGAFEPLYSAPKKTKISRNSSVDYEAAQVLGSGYTETTKQPTPALKSDDSFTSVATTKSTDSSGSQEFSVAKELEQEAEQPGPEEEFEEEPEENPLVPITHIADKEAIRQAMKATASSKASYWAYTLYGDSAGRRPEVHYCTSPQSIARISEHFQNEPVLGFDLEWNPYSKDTSAWWENVSVMQLSSQTHIAIFHLSEAVKLERQKRVEDKTYQTHADRAKAAGIPDDTLASDIIPQNLVDILANAEILKTGVNIAGDCSRMRKYCRINLSGQFELSHLYRLVIYSEKREYEKISKKLVSMAEQAQNVLNLPLYKGDVRTSKWSQRLQKDQILYAASDAYAGLQLFLRLDERRRALRPRPPRPRCQGHPGRIELGKGIALSETSTRKGVVVKEVEIDADAEAALVEIEARAEKAPTATSSDKKAGSGGVPEGEELVADDPETTQRKALTNEASVYADGWMKGDQKPKEAGKVVRPAYLKSYFLWHHKTMSSVEIATLLSIKPTTVDGYICSAIWMAKLPHDKDRFDQIPKPRFTYGARKRPYAQ